MNIVIYGRSSSSRVKHTRLAINSMLQYLGITDKYDVKTTLSDGLHDTSWISDTKLLIMPGAYQGGEDLYGNILRNIHTYVESGGSYLAMCAGAYTSCRYSSFESGDIVVAGAGKIDVFPGYARGSIYHPQSFSSSTHCRMVPLSSTSDNTKSKLLYGLYSGGPEFLPAVGFKEYETVAVYSDFPEKKAVVKRDLEKGKIMLSGVYPILMPEYLDKLEYPWDLLDDMERFRGEQRMLWEIFLTYLLNVKKQGQTKLLDV